MREWRHPFCEEHRFTMVREEDCQWWICPVDGKVVTDEQASRGDWTPRIWLRRLSRGWTWRSA